jgi:hypothetical protein
MLLEACSACIFSPLQEYTETWKVPIFLSTMSGLSKFYILSHFLMYVRKEREDQPQIINFDSWAVNSDTTPLQIADSSITRDFGSFVAVRPGFLFYSITRQVLTFTGC